MKKLAALFVVLSMLVIMLLPVTALASNETPQPTATDNTQPPDDENTEQPAEASGRSPLGMSDLSNIDTSLDDECGSVSALSLTTLVPSEDTKDLPEYNDFFDVYYTDFYFQPAITGTYTFYSLTRGDTDIYFGLPGSTEPFAYDAKKDVPFSLMVYLVAGKTYVMELQNWGDSSSITYLITNPTTLGNTAYTMSPNSDSSGWIQSFDFTVPTAGYYSLHMSCPYTSHCGWELVSGTDNSNFKTVDYSYWTISEEWFHTILLSKGTYHLLLYLDKGIFATEDFTISMDSVPSSASGMIGGKTYSSVIPENDTLTSHYFIPPVTGKYKFVCSDNSAKMTILYPQSSIIDNYLANSISGNSIVENFQKGTKYYIYFVTDGTAETLSYSESFYASQECELKSVSGFSMNGNVVATVMDSSTQTVTIWPTISDYATWALYSDKECKTEIVNKAIPLSSDGINRAYIKVTSDDKSRTKVYPLIVYRIASQKDLKIVVLDSDFDIVDDSGFINGNATVLFFCWSSITPKINDQVCSFYPFLTDDGYYKIDITDGYGNTNEFKFTIDNTLPQISAVDESSAPVSDGALINQDVTANVSDTHLDTAAVTKNGAAYTWPADGVFTEDGSYVITATDAAENSSTLSFTIDQSAPVINAVCAGSAVVDNGYVKGDVIVNVTDSHFKSKTVTKNGSIMAWPSKNKFTSAGTYVVTATDTLNNTSTLTFTIDKAVPVITAKYSGRYTVRNNSCLKYDVAVTVSDANIDTIAATRNDEAYTWPAGGIFTEDGKYVVTVNDKVGNSVSLTFTIDKAVPVITAVSGAIGLSSGANLNTDVSLSVTDNNLSSKSVKKNGSTSAWPAGDTFTASASYVVTAKDKAGNTSTYSFVIDKTAPAISVKTTTGKAVGNAAVTKYDVIVTVSDSYLVSKSIERNETAVAFWPSNNKFTLEGVYVVTATDKAGNTSTYTFTLDKPAFFTVTAGDPPAVIANNAHFNDTLTISYIEQFFASRTLKKDGVAIVWPESNEVSDEGVYTASVTDTIGNISVFTFTIDNTPPVVNAKAASGAAVLDGTISAESSVTVTASDKYLALKSVTKNGVAMRWPSGSKFTAEGVYVVTVKDKAGNVTTFTFTISRTR